MPPPPPHVPILSDDGDSHVSVVGSEFDEEFADRNRRKVDDDRGLRIELPEFEGGTNPDDFLEWLHEIERVFDYKDYGEEKRCKLVVLKFKDYASLWYENVKKQRERDGKGKVRTWTKLKKLLSKRFLPREYKQELYQKMYSCRQGKRLVAEFIVEFEKLMIRTDYTEPKEHTIARFLGGLDRDIALMVELQPYCSLDDVFRLALKVERQKKATGFRPNMREGSGLRGGWSNARPESNNPMAKDKSAVKIDPKPSVPKKENFRDDKAKGRCFKCQGVGHFQANCPNRRVMTLQDWENEPEYQTVEEDEVSDGNEECIAEADEGELLVIRRSMLSKPETNDEQRETIFHTRCTIAGKVYSLIIDGGSCTNVASASLVQKLQLPTTAHPVPYKLHWLSSGSEL